MKYPICAYCGATLKETDFENGKWKYVMLDKPVYFCIKCFDRGKNYILQKIRA